MLIESLATRPDLLDPALELGDIGAEFMRHDPVADLTRAARLATRWPEYFLVLLDDGVPVARAVGVPLAFPTGERGELPDHGWDGAILWAFEDAVDGRAPTTLVALDVQVAAEHRGRGIAARALAALRTNAREHGLARLAIPVRPTQKQDRPDETMADYLLRRRADGYSADAWLRTHERVGGRFVKVAPFAMTITGTLRQWEEWTGKVLRPGPNVVDGALVPVVANVEQDIGVYVEPNVWFEHCP
ncbi:GNAT superfamily N-acetyltransferase [Saccharomonospora amisosensis]|uniref:GNAT superfamily N-acetyltransferase n=1 Tax=Saccharomonospora amisosensis TaxID=1128677 RepID=A0A7X5ZTI3_9PSEU|nr:GNAT family N-acetyltransferase [Saccharomonospora amisosensis]NIJ14997.1 GNAT superfamily N-acetyltransferase [Saccharomonospora amisosensis]